MPQLTEVYLPQPHNFELDPFQDRVLELVRLFHTAPTVRLYVRGIIAAGEPLEAAEEPGEPLTLPGPTHAARRHPLLPLLRQYLCPALDRVSSDAFEIARVITPLLAGLKLSGKVPIDLDPWLFAGIALMVERMGVTAFCAGHDLDDAADPPHPPTPPPHDRRRKTTRHHSRR